MGDPRDAPRDGPSRRSRRRRDSRGFTLLEIAIGMAVLGVGVVSALQVFGGSVRLARAAARRTEAVVHAKALMDVVLWQPELRAGTSHGDIGDGFRWERTVWECRTDDGFDPGDYQGEVKLACVTVKVQWSDGGAQKEFQISTERVVPASEG